METGGVKTAKKTALLPSPAPSPANGGSFWSKIDTLGILKKKYNLTFEGECGTIRAGTVR